MAAQQFWPTKFCIFTPMYYNIKYNKSNFTNWWWQWEGEEARWQGGKVIKGN